MNLFYQWMKSDKNTSHLNSKSATEEYQRYKFAPYNDRFHQWVIWWKNQQEEEDN